MICVGKYVVNIEQHRKELNRLGTLTTKLNTTQSSPFRKITPVHFCFICLEHKMRYDYSYNSTHGINYN
mgnify:CR=1 FL=1